MCLSLKKLQDLKCTSQKCIVHCLKPPKTPQGATPLTDFGINKVHMMNALIRPIANTCILQLMQKKNLLQKSRLLLEEFVSSLTDKKSSARTVKKKVSRKAENNTLERK
ncbi:unnamed protein product [Clavelina lepadiformis]|uniref:Uncharacterized protein n=1 Tax=Clavelina lepadiformis TaxID=159417 RepID=A0ABP0GM01_CLALP